VIISQLPVNGYSSVTGEATQLVDVREPFELGEGILPGVINLSGGMLAYNRA
jgi:rhodanese-related sulfurtransferase